MKLGDPEDLNEGKYLVSDGVQLAWMPIPQFKEREDRADEAELHRAKMAEMHAETMRDAKTGTRLLIALVVVVIYAAAQLAGFVP